MEVGLLRQAETADQAEVDGTLAGYVLVVPELVIDQAIIEGSVAPDDESLQIATEVRMRPLMERVLSRNDILKT